MNRLRGSGADARRRHSGRKEYMTIRRWVLAFAPIVVLAGIPLFTVSQADASGRPTAPKPVTINIPGEDRFTPFAVTVSVGQPVQWVNGDTDDHTVVADDAFTTAGHDDVNHLITGTASPNGAGQFTLVFNHPGTFVYYCRFHAHLDQFNQPVAPGPKGGIQDPKTGNFGTPMMGVITVR
jgi:plastocyanin